MRIKNVTIKNFRGIGTLSAAIDLSDFSIFIGDNGTAKTTILEAVNYCLSPSFVGSRLDVNDFHNGEDCEIEITVEFDSAFNAEVPDGYNEQIVVCNKVTLIAKKREKSAPGKAFSDLVTISHYVIPVATRGAKGWSQPRKTSSSPFLFTERQLSFPSIDVELPKSFYFPKTRNRQLSKGFNSSLSNIISDLNWRFDKSQREKPEAERFKLQRNQFHESVIAETGGDTLKKTIDATNEILSAMGIDKVDISLVKTLTPYEYSEIVFPFDGFELPVEKGGSGVEMAIAIALLEAMAKISKGKIVLVIDEPELHLHPKLQGKLFDHFKTISSEIQIIVSTHSPFLFKSVYENREIQLQISKRESGSIIIQDARSSGFGLLKWSPSWGEICYFAYDVPTIEFHDDLYCSLQDRENKPKIEDIEDWFVTVKGFTKEIIWDSSGTEKHETLMTWIRNRIHHGDNQKRPMYSPTRLKDSIEIMVTLLRHP